MARIPIYIPFIVPEGRQLDLRAAVRLMRRRSRRIFGWSPRTVDLRVGSAGLRGYLPGHLDICDPHGLPVATTMYFYRMLDWWLWSVGGSRLPLQEGHPESPTDRAVQSLRLALGAGPQAVRGVAAVLRAAKGAIHAA